MLKIKTSNYELHKKIKQRPGLTRSASVGVGVFLLLAIGTSTALAFSHHRAAIATTRTAAVLSSSEDSSIIKPTAVASHNGGSASATATGGSVSATKKSATAVGATTAAPSVLTASTASLAGLPLYADPANSATAYAASASAAGNSLIARMGQQPVATWFGGWNSDVAADVATYVNKAAAAHAVPTLVAYNIPNRDCGGYSAGGAQTETDYAQWITQFAKGIGNNQAMVILEPDAISLQDCLNPDQLAARNRELQTAIATLAGGTGTHVYLDAGHSGWLGAAETAKRLQAAGISSASGFSLNISNFTTTASNIDFGTQVSRSVGGKHFVIDTSRNGNGPTADGQWCNPAGRALGAAPTTNTGNSLVDAYLWIKTPWQSDGDCAGAPAAGADFWTYAIKLAQAAGW